MACCIVYACNCYNLYIRYVRVYIYIYIMLFIQFAIKSSHVIDHNKYIVERIVIVIKRLRISCMHVRNEC